MHPLELELQVAVTYLLWVLGTELGGRMEQQGMLSAAEKSLQPRGGAEGGSFLK